MSAANFFQFLALIAVLAITIPPLGRYIAKVYGSEPDGRAPGDRVFLPVERVSTGSCESTPRPSRRWKMYALSLVAFSLVSCVVLYGIQRLQAHLPFNPTHVGAVGPAPVVRHRRRASSPTPTGRATAARAP